MPPSTFTLEIPEIACNLHEKLKLSSFSNEITGEQGVQKSRYGLSNHDDVRKRKRVHGSEEISALRSKNQTVDEIPGVKPEERDYERIPIDKFGLAMLRGMGWHHDTGIGKTNVVSVNPIEVQRRPKGLGLGATPPARPLPTKHAAVAVEPDDGSTVDSLKVGSFVAILDGKWKGSAGKIISVDGDTDRYEVELSSDSLSNRVVTVLGYALCPAKRSAPTDSREHVKKSATAAVNGSSHGKIDCDEIVSSVRHSSGHDKNRRRTGDHSRGHRDKESNPSRSR